MIDTGLTFTFKRGNRMAAQANQSGNEGFVPAQHYKFDQPVETNCIPAGGGQFQRKSFAEGWCLKYDEERGSFAFQGKPVGEEVESYFFVEWGTGSVAENIPAPKL